jgi:hypothetical protein
LTRNFKFGLKLDDPVEDNRELHKYLTHSQEQAAGPYSETVESFPPHISLCLPSVLLKCDRYVVRILHDYHVVCLFRWASAVSHGCTAAYWLIVPPAFDVPTLATRCPRA